MQIKASKRGASEIYIDYYIQIYFYYMDNFRNSV